MSMEDDLRKLVFAKYGDSMFSDARSEDDLEGDTLALYIWRECHDACIGQPNLEMAAYELLSYLETANTDLALVTHELAEFAYIPRVE